MDLNKINSTLIGIRLVSFTKSNKQRIISQCSHSRALSISIKRRAREIDMNIASLY